MSIQFRHHTVFLPSCEDRQDCLFHWFGVGSIVVGQTFLSDISESTDKNVCIRTDKNVCSTVSAVIE